MLAYDTGIIRYSRPIRILHALTAAAITFQLMVSLVMDHPHAARAMSAAGGFYFRCHEWAGLLTAGILLVGWIYRVLNWKREAQSALFPWISMNGCNALVGELKSFLLLRWTRISERSALAGTVHGLGLLAASTMAATGTAVFIGLGSANKVTPGVHTLMSIHSTLATFMWIYLYGHVLMAFWHQIMGHGTLRAIFSFGQR